MTSSFDRKIIVLLFILAILVFASCHSRKDIIDSSRNGVVSLTASTMSGRSLKPEKRNGSGFFVSKELLVTAYHVYKGMSSEVDRYPSGYAQMVVEKHGSDGAQIFSIPIEVVLTDEGNDLALFKIDYQLFDRLGIVDRPPILEVAPTARNLRVGDEVLMSGFRGDESDSFTSIGYVSLVSKRGVSTEDLPAETVYSSFTSLPGNSGAPILSLSSGRVVGVQLGALNWNETPSGMSYAANSKFVLALIGEYQSRSKTN